MRVLISIFSAATVCALAGLVSGQPLNDDCASHVPLSDGVTTFDMTGAVTDGPSLTGVCDFDGFGDQVIHQDIWFCYTASCNGSVTISTAGSGFDTRLAAYDGCSCPALPANMLSCDEDSTPDFEAIMTFPVAAQTSYLIQLGAFDEARIVGPGILTVECSGTPPNDDCANATPVGNGVTSYNNGGATTSGADLGVPCAGAFTSGDTQIHRDLWYEYTATCDGTVAVEIGPDPLNTRIAVYAGLSCPDDPGMIVACNDDISDFDFGSRVTFAANTNDTFLVRVGSFSDGDGGPGEMTIKCEEAAANDDCANAVPVGDGVFAFNNSSASTDGADTGGSCTEFTAGDSQIHNDLWYAYTAPCDGTVLAELDGFDTRIAVYSELTCPGDPFFLLTCDDDGGPGPASRVVFDAVSGQEFLIRVGGFNENTNGTGTLTIACMTVTNDDCVDSIAIGDGVTEFDLATTTTDGPDLVGFCDLGEFGDEIVHQDAWFCYTASCDGSATFSTLGSDQDTRLAVYDGCSCPADPASVLACDDDGLGYPPGESEITVAVVQGGSYLVQVGTYAEITAGGPGTLTASCNPCSPVLGIQCNYDCAIGVVNLNWTNTSDFDFIDISQNGVLVAMGLSGDTESFVVDSPPRGDVTYTVTGTCPGGIAVSADCAATVAVPGQDLVLALEGLQSGSDLGDIDSGAALAAALAANGRTVALLRADFDSYPCLNELLEAAEIVWVATGTYPLDYRLDAEEATLLGEIAGQGKGLYFESGDHWGFDHVPSLLDTRDGIELDVGDNIDDGDDSFNEMDGQAAPLAGLDLSVFQDVVYVQDTIEQDYTDQLSLTGTTMGVDEDVEVVTAEVIWRNSPNLVGETDYISGVIAVHADGGVMVSSSWEFGGFQGDRDALAAAYVAVLNLGGGGVNAIRGDVDGNGTFNALVDGLFGLNFGFVPGSLTPPCSDASDADGNGQFNALVDGLFILGAGFIPGSPLPPAPFPDCGEITIVLGCDGSACP